MSIGNNIRNIRKEKGMTLQQIADALGCGISDIDENIYMVSPFNPTTERMEWFKLEAEATQIYEKAQNVETLTSEDQLKIIDYKKELKFQAEQREEAAKKAPKFTDASTSFEESQAKKRLIA